MMFLILSSFLASWISPIRFFLDPIFQAPTLGCMLMCLASSCMGVIVQLKKRSLVGEALSHASYPGIALGVLLYAGLFAAVESLFFPFLIGGALISSYLGLKFLYWLEERFQINSDAALCFVLSTFLGLGVLIASRMQFSHPLFYQQIQLFLYGQASTLVLFHVLIYGILSLCVVLSVRVLFHQIRAAHFDETYSKVVGVPVTRILFVTRLLLVLAIVVGVRSVGVVLMAGMLVAPAVAARQLSDRLSHIFVYSAVVGLLSGFLGNYLSVNLSLHLLNAYQIKITLPTGPIILIVAALFAFLSMLFAPKKGAFFRFVRIQRFHIKCLKENVLKAVFKSGGLSFKELKGHLHVLVPLLWVSVKVLTYRGLIQKQGKVYRLTDAGSLYSKKIVRLHRLWELYLHLYLGFDAQRVHTSAEEMEHILTPELERELTKSLDNPVSDPHDQLIPEWEGGAK